MAQTYQMKHNPQGTIYSLLTVESDGRMTMTFHGTDREISHEANVTEDGRITTGGSLFPGLESGRWQLMNDVVETTEHAEQAVIEETTNCTNYTNNEPLTNNRETITNNREPSDISPQPSSTLKAIGMVAAATVALVVIYETGLLIPLGLIGLATGGILK